MCEDILFADVCAVLHKLSDPFVKPVEKLNYFSRYLDKIEHESPVELFPLLRLLTPSLDRRRPPSQLRQPLLARVYAQVFALPPAAAARLRLYKDPAAVAAEAGTSARVGDFGSFVIATLKRRIGTRSPTITVRELNARLDRVCLATTFPEKIAVLHELFPLLTANEHKWFVRILMKDVKLGGLTGERLLTVLHSGARKIINQCSDLQSTLEAIEEQLKVETGDDGSRGGANRWREHGSAARTGDREQLSVETQESNRLLFCPLRPMLAHPVRPEVADIQLELFPAPSGDVVRAASGSHVYFIERKYDGERMFAHIDLSRNRKTETEVREEDKVRRAAAAESLASCVRLFSRRGRDISEQYGGSKSSSIAHDNTQEGDMTPQASVDKLESARECDQRDAQPGEEKKLRPAENAVLDGLRVMLAKALRGDQAVLDGELLAWDDERGTFLPFGTNKSVAVSETTSCHLSYVVFDILFYRNTEGAAYNLLSMQLKDRKQLLARVLKPVGSRIMLASYVEATEANQVIDAFNAAVQKRHEGIVVKRATSFYRLHSRRGGWYKIKPRTGCLSDTLDLIVIGAYFAETTRRREHTSTHAIDHCSHFLLGVLEGTGGPTATRVRSFCRIGSGFSLTDLAQMRDFVRPYCRRLPPLDGGRPGEKTSVPPWLENFRLNASTRVDVTWPPSRSFVMEVSAAEIIPSVEFDVGFTLRFATATRPFRRDKDWYEAMSEADLKAFLLTCEERGGIRIAGSETTVGSIRPAIKSEPVSSAEEEASDQDTDEESDEGMHNAVDVAAEDRSIYGTQKDSWASRGQSPDKATFEISPSRSGTSHPHLISGNPSNSLTSTRGGQRLRRLSSRPWRPAPVKASFLDVSTPPVELQSLIPRTATGSSVLSSTALRGQCVWVMEGADEQGDEVSSHGGREQQLTEQDVKPTKAALEWLVTALGGTVAPALSHSVTHVIASRHSFRTEAAVGAFAEALSSTYGRKGAKGTTSPWRRDVDKVATPPVLRYNWLLDCARLNTLAPVRPAHVLHGTPALAREFADQYDKYGDAYFEPDSSPRSLLLIVETAVAHGQDGTYVRSSSTSPQRTDPSSESYSTQEGRQRSVGESAEDVNSEETDVQLADLRRAIAQVSDSPEFSSMVLYVSPGDVVWEPPCAINLLRPSSVGVAPHFSTSPAHGPDTSGSPAALSRPRSNSTTELQKAIRAALIARCCMRGMRLTFNAQEATHVLKSSPGRREARSVLTSDASLEVERSLEVHNCVADTSELIGVNTENLRPEKIPVDDRNLNAADMHGGGSGEQTPNADKTRVKHHVRLVSEAYLDQLFNQQPELRQC